MSTFECHECGAANRIPLRSLEDTTCVSCGEVATVRCRDCDRSFMDIEVDVTKRCEECSDDPSQPAHYVGDCRDLLRRLPDGCVQTCITSPPYWGLRDYGHEGQIGLEPTPEAYVAELVAVFREVRRALADDGTLWLNLGDSYASAPSGGNGSRSSTLGGSTAAQTEFRKATKHKNIPDGLKPKDLVGIPWMVAFALRADGWYLRSEIIWHKPNPMPESVMDRPTKAHEHVFLFAKSERYYYDADAIAEPAHGSNGSTFTKSKTAVSQGERVGAVERQDGATRNKRDVWTVTPKPFAGAHFATMPPDLVEPCVLAGSRLGDVVLDPFFGSGTTGMVAEKHGRRWIGFDLGYGEIAKGRTAQRSLAIGVAP